MAWRLLAVAVVMWCIGSASAAVDLARAERGERLRCEDRELARLHARLFAEDPGFLELLIHRIQREYPQQADTVLASRLLVLRPRRSGILAEQRDEAIKLAILRALRYRDDPTLAPLYPALLARARAPAVAKAALFDHFQLDHRAAGAEALRLVVANARDAHPASVHLEVRRFALRMMTGHLGSGDSGVVAALRYAITHDDVLQCHNALSLMVPGQQPGLVTVAMERLLVRVALGEDDGEAWSAFLAALRHCRLEAGHPLTGRMVAMAVDGDRAMTVALAGAVADGRVGLSADHLAALRDYAMRAEDEAVRRCLLALMVDHDPAAAAGMVSDDDPWSRVIEARRNSLFEPGDR